MSHTLLLSLFWLNSWFSANAGWLSTLSTLIRSDDSFAVGAYNNSIFFLGGRNNHRQITQYKLDLNTFTYIGENVLHSDIYGYSQFWSQKDEMIYMIQPLGTSLSTFNMSNQQHTASWTTIDVAVSELGCLASSNEYLYIVGGYHEDYLDTLQIMDLLTYEWMNDTPTMNERRGYHACIIYNHYLWVFGGYNEVRLISNERINILNVTSNKWNYIEPLTVAASSLRATAWHQKIFIIGGYTETEFIDTVHIVDIMTGNVTLSVERLIYGVAGPGIAIKDNVIYIFGGYNPGALNTWMLYKLPSMNNSLATFKTTDYTTTSDVIPTTIPIVPSNTPSDLYRTSNTIPITSASIPNTLATFEATDPLTSFVSNDPQQEIDDDIVKHKKSHNLWFIVAAIAFSVLLLLIIGAIVSNRNNKQQIDNNNNNSMIMKECDVNVDEQEIGENDITDVKSDKAAGNVHHIGVSTLESRVFTKQGNRKELEVQYWLENVVKLSQYYDVFMANGYESLSIIKEITNVTYLFEIGIESTQHQTKLLQEIQELSNIENERGRIESFEGNEMMMRTQEGK